MQVLKTYSQFLLEQAGDKIQYLVFDKTKHNTVVFRSDNKEEAEAEKNKSADYVLYYRVGSSAPIKV